MDQEKVEQGEPFNMGLSGLFALKRGRIAAGTRPARAQARNALRNTITGSHL
jgi:hypothetical protein